MKLKPRKTSITFAVALVATLAAALMGACASKPEGPPPAPVQRVIQGATKSIISVTDTDADARLVLERSQELLIQLPLDVTTGLDWTLVDMKPGVLVLGSTRFERTRRDRNDFENDGDVEFRLKPAASGDVTLTFALRRPRSLLPAVQTLTFAVTVK